MPSILAAGPWMGEFGFELFEWQGCLRYIADQYDQVIVSSRPGNEVLYEDFCADYIPYEADINPCEGFINGNGTEYLAISQDVFKGIPYTRIISSAERFRKDAPQKHVKFGKRNWELKYDVVIHARHIQVSDADQMSPGHAEMKMSRNWDNRKWVELSLYIRQHGWRACSIGLNSAALCLPGTDDLRGIPLSRLADILASSKVIVGPSSGPHHFASLCGCPQLVWGTEKLIPRYNHIWNPLNTELYFLGVDDQWDPPVHRVCGMLRAALQ